MLNLSVVCSQLVLLQLSIERSLYEDLTSLRLTTQSVSLAMMLLEQLRLALMQWRFMQLMAFY